MVCIISLTISSLSLHLLLLHLLRLTSQPPVRKRIFIPLRRENLLHKFPPRTISHTKRFFPLDHHLNMIKRETFMTPKESRHGSNLKLDSAERRVYATERNFYSSSNMLIMFISKTIVIIKR